MRDTAVCEKCCAVKASRAGKRGGGPETLGKLLRTLCDHTHAVDTTLMTTIMTTTTATTMIVGTLLTVNKAIPPSRIDFFSLLCMVTTARSRRYSNISLAGCMYECVLDVYVCVCVCMESLNTVRIVGIMGSLTHDAHTRTHRCVYEVYI